jgi:transposase
VTARESLPTDLAAAHALILAERTARIEAEARLAVARAEAANAQADLSSTEAFISHLKLEIEKLRRQLYGTRSERKARLLEQMELQLEELCRATIWMRRGGGNQSLKAAAGSEVMIDLSR